MKVPTLANLKAVQHLPPGYHVYIGMGTPYGNRFANKIPRNQAVAEFERTWREALARPEYGSSRYATNLLENLSGAVLLCHCAPKPCHGDVLIKLFKEVFHDKLEVDDDQGTASQSVGQ